jgi:sterol desaturase/sphingolipid hydroxylase (fatty acid hydroxylase superfamily)
MYMIQYLLHIFFIITSFDIWFYYSHVLLHSHFYHIHKIHHEPNYLSLHWTDTYKAHILETPFQSIGFLFPYLFIRFNTYVFIFSVFYLNVRGTLRHDIRFTKFVGNHHLLHHKYLVYNYGEYWIDKLFNTNFLAENNDK